VTVDTACRNDLIPPGAAAASQPTKPKVRARDGTLTVRDDESKETKGFGSPLRLAMAARRLVGGGSGAQVGGCVRAWRNGASCGARERRAAAERV
jgi:hypothetical protein